MEIADLPQPLEFEWDAGNTTKSLLKHSVSNQEAEDAFFNFNIILKDQRHSGSENRLGMYGQTNSGKILFVAFTIRGQRVRIISARPADKKERKLYEEKIKKIT